MAKTRPADDALFDVPPAEFVRERNRLVARLRASGQGDDARALGRLRKPSVALWAANRAARSEPAAVARLIQAVDRVKAAQLGGRQDLRDAMESQRSTLDELIASARRAIGAAGARATPEVLVRVSATLLGAAIDANARADLRAGRLLDERAAPGFEAFGDAVASVPARRAERPARAPKRAPPAPRPGPSERRAPVVALDAAIRAREARQKAEAERDERARHATELEATAERRSGEARTAETELAAARRQVRDAGARVTRTRRTAAEARRAAQRARREAERAARTVSGPRARARRSR